jgi:hypothetical protein
MGNCLYSISDGQGGVVKSRREGMQCGRCWLLRSSGSRNSVAVQRHQRAAAAAVLVAAVAAQGEQEVSWSISTSPHSLVLL